MTWEPSHLDEMRTPCSGRGRPGRGPGPGDSDRQRAAGAGPASKSKVKNSSEIMFQERGNFPSRLVGNIFIFENRPLVNTVSVSCFHYIDFSVYCSDMSCVIPK